MSTKDPAAQARKFLEQLRVVQRENAALWEEIMDPESRALQGEYGRLMIDMATAVKEAKQARALADVLRRKIEAAGIDPAEVPMASTKNQLKDAVRNALVLLRYGKVEDAIAALERRVT